MTSSLLGALGFMHLGPGVRAAELTSGTRVTGVSVQRSGDDATVVEVTFDGPIAGHRRFHMNGEAPRALLRIAGIVEAYRPYEVPVGDGRVQRIRIGHHPELEPPEEHLVFDLADAGVEITRVEEQGRALRVVLERIAPGQATRPTARPTRTPLPSPTATPPPPTPSPSPTAIATATAAPPSTATGAPPTATATATRPAATPTPTALPVATRRATPSPSTPPPPARATSSASERPAFPGPLLTELVISHRDDGSALVRVSADRTLEAVDVRYFGVRGEPPRNVLSLTGVGLPGEGGVLPVRDGLLCEVQVIFRSDAQPPRTEVVFFLASADVTAERAAVKGANAVVHLRPPEDPETPLGCDVEERSGTKGWRFVAGKPPQALN
jgi:hypothetical protein